MGFMGFMRDRRRFRRARSGAGAKGRVIGLCIVALHLGLATRAGAAYFFTVSYTDNRINQIDADTGALLNSYAPPVVAQSGGGEGLGMSDAVLFFASIDNATIFTLNPSNGAVVNTFSRPATASAIDGLGWGQSTFGATLFAQDYNANKIYLLNPSTGAVFNSYTTSFDAIGGVDYDTATGELYLTDQGGNVYAVNPNTGAVLHSFSTGLFQTGVGFVGGRMFTASQNVATISERNPLTGAVINTLPSPGNQFIGAIAGPPVPGVPEPTSLLLLLSGIGVGAGMRRRRRRLHSIRE
jgi:outer membrane protein assembly factor BamB